MKNFPQELASYFQTRDPGRRKRGVFGAQRASLGRRANPHFPLKKECVGAACKKKKSLAHCCKSTHNFNTFNVCIFAKKSLIFYVLCNVPLLYLVILPFSLMSKSPSSQLVRWQKTFAAKIALQRRCPRQRCCVGGAGWGIGVSGWTATLQAPGSPRWTDSPGRAVHPSPGHWPASPAFLSPVVVSRCTALLLTTK